MNRTEQASAFQKALKIEEQENTSIRFARVHILLFSGLVMLLELVCRASGAILEWSHMWVLLIIFAEQLYLIGACLTAYFGRVGAASAMLSLMGIGSILAFFLYLSAHPLLFGGVWFPILFGFYAASVLAFGVVLRFGPRFHAFGQRAREIRCSLAL